MSALPPVVAVVGPTATGKTALAVALAQRLGGEVVNADSMQLYRGMDIGTAKPDETERGGVPHHLLDLWHVRQPASVAEYRDRARAEIDRLRRAGTVPLLVGGSGLYVRAALDRLEIPPTDAEVRTRLEAESAVVGGDALHARLRGLDPRSAASILPGNLRRVIRALEVIELTGRPFSATMPQREFVSPAVVLGLRIDRDVLVERIDRRVERMWEDGLRTETQALLGVGLRHGVTARRAIGYSQAIAVVDGDLDETAARRDTAQATRRYARRQESWFRPDPRIVWLDAASPDLLDQALTAVREADAQVRHGMAENA